jgi:hypothetical protein
MESQGPIGSNRSPIEDHGADAETLRQYMLTALQLSAQYSSDLEESKRQATQYCLTLISLLIGVTASVLAATKPDLKVVGTVSGIVGCLVGVVAVWMWNIRFAYTASASEAVLESDVIHKHFGSFDQGSYSKKKQELIKHRRRRRIQSGKPEEEHMIRDIGVRSPLVWASCALVGFGVALCCFSPLCLLYPEASPECTFSRFHRFAFGCRSRGNDSYLLGAAEGRALVDRESWTSE